MTVRAEWEADRTYAVVVEDDGARVAYAYLLHQGKVVADVWLYNRGGAPARPEWERQDATELLPFKNPRGFAQAASFAPISDPGQVAIIWEREPDGRVRAEVRIRGELHARLLEGAKPGSCRLAIRDGPVACEL